MDCHIPYCSESGFGLENLPYGVFSRADLTRHIGVRVGHFILDLTLLEKHGFIDLGDNAVFSCGALNCLASQGEPIWSTVREVITALLTRHDSILSDPRVC